eukprot:3897173-Karenia_brevis.AAC.1
MRETNDYRWDRGGRFPLGQGLLVPDVKRFVNRPDNPCFCTYHNLFDNLERMDAIVTSDHYNTQSHPYFPPPTEIVQETLEERIQAWKAWGEDT